MITTVREWRNWFCYCGVFFDKQSYDSFIYRTEKLMPVCSMDYCFCNKIDKLKDIVKERLIVMEKDSGTREVLEREWKEHNLNIEEFKYLIEIGNLNTIKAMVCGGAGIAFFYKPVVQKNWIVNRIRGLFCISWFYILWRKGSIFSKDYKQIFQLLKESKTEEQ